MTLMSQNQLLDLIFTSSYITLGLVVSWGAWAMALDNIGKKAPKTETFDALVVLGCAVRPDGTPSAALRRRTMHAVDLWHQGMAPRIIMTGGVGRHAPAESVVSAAIAKAHGVPNDAILIEDQSTNTRENAHFASTVLSTASTWSVLVVTDGYHCWRSRRIFSQHFASAMAIGSTPNIRLRVKGALREVISIIYMLIR